MKKARYCLMIVIFISFGVLMNTGMSQPKPSNTSTILPIKTLQIGEQVWMAKNLDVSTFRNGDPILQVKDTTGWVKAGEKGTPAWCYYDNNPSNGKLYGKLYNWYAVTDSRGLAPKGWHIPGKEEFETLVTHYGGEGTNVYNVLLSGGSSGFSSLFGGYRGSSGLFYGLDGVSGYWSASGCGEDDAWSLLSGSLHRQTVVDYISKGCGCSIRCVKD